MVINSVLLKNIAYNHLNYSLEAYLTTFFILLFSRKAKFL
nr:MAG TPA: hypothetical protein [Caudoviricetes sp.]